jgi:predicted dehydrogenase
MQPKRVVGLSFAHMHMGDLLRFAFEHPDVEIAGIWDDESASMAEARREFDIPGERVFNSAEDCIAQAKPDLAILCPAPSEHANLVERVAALGVPILIEKPFALSLADADRMIAACQRAGVALAVNWPMAWYPGNLTAKRLLDEGAIGSLRELHYYDGNRGPLYHGADKLVVSEEVAQARKSSSWWYRRDHGGGSLLDYLGYGVTLGTWFMAGRMPRTVTTVADQPAGLEVDEHSITVCHYDCGLSKFETRWGTFTDPWSCQPQPKCGFVLVGTEGTIACYDFEPTISVQTRQHPQVRSVPVDLIAPPHRNPVEYVLHCLDKRQLIEGPLSPQISRIGQRILDSAQLSAAEARTVELLG